MPDRMNRDEELSHAQYNARIGTLFLRVNSSDHNIRCRALAMTDWQDIRESDAVALLAPLATDPDVEVRQLVALQLATAAGSADDPRALQALITLVADDDPVVRAAAARSSYIASEFSLTPDDQSAISPAVRFVDWRQEGLSVRKMTHRSDEKQIQPHADKGNDLADEPKRLPDVIMDEETSQVLDLPRNGTPKAVMNVAKASVRLPDILIVE